MFEPSEFAVFGGSSEWLVPGLIGGTQGAVTGLANTHPRSCVELFQLVREGKLREAVELQGLVSRTEWAMAKTGLAGTKYAVELQKRCGEMGAKVLPRRPLQECSETEKLWIKETMADLTLYEQRLLNSERPKS
jgi:dihydrodipicolinate synthase/N-acetylneuraminate lyase